MMRVQIYNYFRCEATSAPVFLPAGCRRKCPGLGGALAAPIPLACAPMPFPCPARQRTGDGVSVGWQRNVRRPMRMRQGAVAV